MNWTIFDTPVLNKIMWLISVLILKLVGWRAEGKLPDSTRCVMIAAPHTSNWDLPYTLLIAFALKIKIFWMGKDAIFRQPFRAFFLWLGGIPIDRSKTNNVVDQSIEQFKKNKDLILVVPPSGTRKKVSYWKTGFYHIANGAKVPISLGYLDYSRKAGGIGPTVMPTGNIDEDMKIIKQFYSNITGKYPEKSFQTNTVKLTVKH